MNTSEFSFKNYAYLSHCKNAVKKNKAQYGYCEGRAYVCFEGHLYRTESHDLTSFELLEMVLDFEFNNNL